MRSSIGGRALPGISLLLALIAGSCSCGTEDVKTGRSLLAIGLDVDPSGEADFVLDFGEVAIGDVASRRFTLRNEGGVVLSAESSRPAPPFFFNAAGPLVLPAGASTELRIRFEPEEVSPPAYRQLLLLSTDEGASGKTYRIRLQGVGVRAGLVCDPAALDFGNVVKGNVASRRIVCTNRLSLPIEVGELAFRGVHAPLFSGRVVGESRVIEAAGTIELEVELRAETLGRIEASLEVQAAFSDLLATIPLRAEGLSSQVVVEPASCVDFGYVRVGDAVRAGLTLRNLRAQPTNVTGITVAEEDRPHLSVLSPTPLLLAAGALGTVDLEFHPATDGLHLASISLETDEPGAQPLTACARGFGGGPALSCSAESIDFGMVAVGVPATATLRCTNSGSAPEGVSVDPLFLAPIVSSSERFQASIRNEDGSRGAKSAGYPIGASFSLEVVYDPIDEGPDAGELLLESNANSLQLPVQGQGRLLPPCEFSVVPPAIRFGAVDRGVELVREFEIRNHLDTACLVRDLRVSDDSDPAFSIEAVGHFELQGQGALSVPVRFAPKSYASSLRGKVEFEISSPVDPLQEVELQGSSVRPCLLLEPAELDFGAVGPGCNNLGRTMVISNICGTPVTISSIELGGASSEEGFVLSRKPGSPLVLQPGKWTEATVAFSPPLLGDRLGSLEVETAEGIAYVAPLRGKGATGVSQIDDFTQPSRPSIDILWVIDNSGSMGSYQQQLRDNLPAFLDMAVEQRADFQIGVTTTALIFGGSGCPGGANGEENGRLFPVDGSHPRILRPDTPNLEQHWKYNMMVGTCFGPNAESAMEGAYQALSPPLINETKDSRYPMSGFQDGNAGFLRPTASLSIVLVTDAQDFSPRSNAEYAEFFLGLKRGNRSLVKVHSISGPRGGGSGCAAQRGDRLVDLVEETDGTWMSICTPTSDTKAWTTALSGMATGVFSFVQRMVLRGAPADKNGNGRQDEGDLEVRVDGILQQSIHPETKMRIWTYDPVLNSIDFAPLFVPKPNAKISVKYELACL